MYENRLQRHLHKKIGFSAGYGSLRGSVGFEVGAKNPGKKNSFISFSWRRPNFGVTARYVRLQEYVDGTFTAEGQAPLTFTSDQPGTMRTMTGDVYYLLNGHKFDYNATQGCSVEQRRSSGSLMIIGKYLQGDFSLDKAESFMKDLSEGLYRYTTQQVSVGAGYSYNLVAFHRDSYDRANWKGYRNLTFNFTAIPMASVYNRIYTLNQRGNGSPTKNMLAGSIVPSWTLRSGLSFSWDRFGLVGTAVYNRFVFHKMRETVRRDAHQKYEFDTDGVFDDLTAKISLVVRL